MCIGTKISRLQKKQSGEVSEQTQTSIKWATLKTLVAFHYTDWFIEILTMAHYNYNPQ